MREPALGCVRSGRQVLLPDGVEDYWSPELADLIALA
jgi:hypothetical protein